MENPSIRVKDKIQEVSHLNDDEIIELFFARNEEAISQTHGKYGPRLMSLAGNILKNQEDAQECVNDTYFKAWDTIPPARPIHFYAYLARICRNLSFGRLDWNNAAKRNGEVVALTQEMEECIPGTWQDTDSRELVHTISTFLRAQKAENRLIFVRRYWYADTTAQIAQRYGISESAVLMRLHRTREKLAAYLKKEGINV